MSPDEINNKAAMPMAHLVRKVITDVAGNSQPDISEVDEVRKWRMVLLFLSSTSNFVNLEFFNCEIA
jgi:hypothetical protein